jgi:hypothetical protein
MSGPNAFYFGSAANGEGIEQTLSTAFAIDGVYSLSVSVGERKGGNMASVRMDLLAGTSVLASITLHNSTPDSFADFSVGYNASGHPEVWGLAGEPLGVRFLEIDNRGPTGVELDIDNVRLLVPVPEPSAYAMVVGSGLAIFSLRRKFHCTQNI